MNVPDKAAMRDEIIFIDVSLNLNSISQIRRPYRAYIDFKSCTEFSYILCNKYKLTNLIT